MTDGIDPYALDEWNVRTMRMPATVMFFTLQDTPGWPDPRSSAWNEPMAC